MEINAANYSLLHKVDGVCNKYKEINKLTGESFNVFSIMRIDRNEVYTHSAFIAELLNSNGSHGQGSIYLNLFIEVINKNYSKNIPKIGTSNSAVEKSIGVISSDGKKGGRIDVMVESADHLLMIENKIYAGDQRFQLLRYYNYGLSCEKKGKEFTLFYLTLYGNKPSAFTTGENEKLQEDVISISYKEYIINWLELSKKEAVNYPILRETIAQYINLLKRLTKQTSDHRMAAELNSIILESYANYSAAQTITQQFENAKRSFYIAFWRRVSVLICKDLGSKWQYKFLGDTTILFYYDNWDIVGFAIHRLMEDRSYWGIFKNQSKNTTDLSEHYNTIIYNTANKMLNTAESGWTQHEFIRNVNVFNDQYLPKLMPLNDSERVEDIVQEIAAETKSLIFADLAYKEFIIKMVNILSDIEQTLETLSEKLKESFASFEIKVWERCILYINISVNGHILAIDNYWKDRYWHIHIFIRYEENFDILTDLLRQANILEVTPFTPQTPRQGIIYRAIPDVDTKILESELISILKNFN